MVGPPPQIPLLNPAARHQVRRRRDRQFIARHRQQLLDRDTLEVRGIECRYGERFPDGPVAAERILVMTTGHSGIALHEDSDIAAGADARTDLFFDSRDLAAATRDS